MLEQRLIDLETKVLHQEMALEEAQKALYEQFSLITKLEKNLKLLTERMNAGGGGKPDIGPGDEKPPHY